MNKEKIALIVDSGTSVPSEYIEKYGIKVLPLVVIYKDRTYLDQLEISSEEVCERLKEEIPKTSLPTPDIAYKTFEEVKAEGYTKAIVVCVSSGLSNTYSMVCGVAADIEGLDIEVIDTKNIGIAAGLSVLMAAELVEKGETFEQVCKKVRDNVPNTKVFFCVETLEYLQKGGRIGLVSSILGSALNLKPVISCNDDGVYYTVTKARGRAKSLKAAIESVKEVVKDYDKYNIAVVHVGAQEEASRFIEDLKGALPSHNKLIEGIMSSALTVHVGPGIIGVGVQKVDW